VGYRGQAWHGGTAVHSICQYPTRCTTIAVDFPAPTRVHLRQLTP